MKIIILWTVLFPIAWWYWSSLFIFFYFNWYICTFCIKQFVGHCGLKLVQQTKIKIYLYWIANSRLKVNFSWKVCCLLSFMFKHNLQWECKPHSYNLLLTNTSAKLCKSKNLIQDITNISICVAVYHEQFLF